MSDDWGNDPLQDAPAAPAPAPSATAGKAAPPMMMMEVTTKADKAESDWGNDPLQDADTAPHPKPKTTNFLGFEAPIQGVGDEPKMLANTEGPPPTTAAGVAGALSRGLAPVAAGAAAGAALGAPLAGVGAIPGAAVGAGAVGLMELGAAVYNPLATALGLPRMASPQDATDAALNAIGVAKPQSPIERTLEAGVSSAGGTVGTAAGARELSGSLARRDMENAALAAGGDAAARATAKARPIVRGVANAMGENPGQQAVSGLQAGMASQAAQEMGVNPIIATPLSVAAGMTAGAQPYVPEGEAAAAARAARGNVKTQNKAIGDIEERVNQDVRGSPRTAQETLDRMTRARDLGHPKVIADIGPNTRGLLGVVQRAPGESKSIARTNLYARDQATPQRVTEMIERDMQTGPSVWRAGQALSEQRVADSAPLFDSAMAGGSIAPLNDQLAQQYTEAVNRVGFSQRAHEAARQELAAALAARPPEMSIYDNAPENRRVRMAVAREHEARQRLAQATAQRDETYELLQRARNDNAMHRPGAVWTPIIGRLITNPIMRRGMQHGVLEERVDADTEGRPYHFTEVDVDEDGNIINVPTMRILAAGKEGLDAIIEAEGRDDFGRLNKWGTKVYRFQQELLREMDRINPDYAAARQMWSGYSASRDALRWGENLPRRMDPEQITHEFNEMTDSEREFARLGVAQTLRMKVLQTAANGDEAKKILNSEWERMQLAPIFRTPEDFERMVFGLEQEREMFETNRQTFNQSATAERTEETDAKRRLNTTSRVARMLSYFPSHRMRAMAEGINAFRSLRLNNEKAVNAQVAQILTDIGADLYMTPEGALGVRPAGGFPAPLPLPPSAAGAMAGLQGQLSTQTVPGQ